MRHDRVERLGRRRHAILREEQQQLARDTDALLDVEGIVHVRIVDQALPADGRTRLLEVDAHQHEQRVPDALCERAQPRGIFACRSGVVDGTGAHHHEQPRVLPLEDPPQRAAAAIHEFLRRDLQRQRLLDLFRRRQQLAGQDVDVVQALLHGRGRSMGRLGSALEYAAAPVTASHMAVRTVPTPEEPQLEQFREVGNAAGPARATLVADDSFDGLHVAEPPELELVVEIDELLGQLIQIPVLIGVVIHGEPAAATPLLAAYGWLQSRSR